MTKKESIEFYEDEKEMRLLFKNGIDPQVIIDAIHEISADEES